MHLTKTRFEIIVKIEWANFNEQFKLIFGIGYLTARQTTLQLTFLEIYYYRRFKHSLPSVLFEKHRDRTCGYNHIAAFYGFTDRCDRLGDIGSTEVE